jgi:hypothetical protein
MTILAFLLVDFRDGAAEADTPAEDAGKGDEGVEEEEVTTNKPGL